MNLASLTRMLTICVRLPQPETKLPSVRANTAGEATRKSRNQTVLVPSYSNSSGGSRLQEADLKQSSMPNWILCAHLIVINTCHQARKIGMLVSSSRERRPWPIVVAAALPCRYSACSRKSCRQASQLSESSNQVVATPPPRW